MNTMQINLNSHVELNLARTVYKKRGRILLPDFLSAHSAKALSDLAPTLPYHLTMNKTDDGVANITQVDLAARGQEFHQRLMSAVYAQASSAFRYFYGQFEYDKNQNAPGDLGSITREVRSFLNGEAFLSALRKMTGIPDLTHTTGQASCYKPGHFLTSHDDDVKDSGRRAAFVLYLSPTWRADWGGLLQFIDRDGHVAEAFTPTFNALAVFRVPTVHSVSMVTPLAPAARYAITGWVH